MQPTVMIIDDNAMMREFLSVYFGKEYQVVSCKSGLEGLEKLAEGLVPEIILLDLNMPFFSGFEFLATLRSKGIMRKTRVIVLSGESKSDDRIRSLSLGAADYVSKPFNPQELSLRARNVLSTLSQTA
jgi:DNA-binding response OmpR family regulator